MIERPNGGCPLSIKITVEGAVDLADCVKSKAAGRIIAALRDSGQPLSITALCRKAGCSRRDALRYLSALIRLGAVEEKRIGRLRLFKLLNNPVSSFMLGVVERAGGRVK
jgi:DNA-binding transcriptional ArsR family regulator